MTDFLVRVPPQAEEAEGEAGGTASSSEQSDHPLSLEEGSRWRGFHESTPLLAEIEKDLLRTHQTMHFFGDLQTTVVEGVGHSFQTPASVDGGVRPPLGRGRVAFPF